jgi:hypothetical protein
MPGHVAMNHAKAAKEGGGYYAEECLTLEAKRKRHLSLQLKGQFHARLRARRKPDDNR